MSENSDCSRALNWFESQIVIAYVQKFEISENGDCSRAHNWIRISDSNCIRPESRNFWKTATAVEPINGFESEIVIACVQNLVSI
ncbi:hypothetical protein CEXT_387571 [Caerostris extrusa]|uniref:Uncharacterized protein n=1 Tax=Caerostris extrusa TaxID=172846 RepID=A0AAV4TYP9_CAEEX|nr:hypothetical protein CEXT_387571 [Caerostris extrusa]